MEQSGLKKDQFACLATLHQVFFNIVSINEDLCMQQELFTCTENLGFIALHCLIGPHQYPYQHLIIILGQQQSMTLVQLLFIINQVLSRTLQHFLQGKTFCLETLLKYISTGPTGCLKKKYPLLLCSFLGFQNILKSSSVHLSTAQLVENPKVLRFIF